MINPHRYTYIINTGTFQKLYEVHRYLPIPDLSNYYLKLLYAKEITKFPYQTNSHQNFNYDYFQVFRHSQTILFFSDPSLKVFTIRYCVKLHDGITCITLKPWTGLRISRTNGESQEIHKLLTKDPAEQELITWDWINWCK